MDSKVNRLAKFFRLVRECLSNGAGKQGACEEETKEGLKGEKKSFVDNVVRFPRQDNWEPFAEQEKKLAAERLNKKNWTEEDILYAL